MSLLDKIYYFWEDIKNEQSALFYMIATFLAMVLLCVAIGLFALPIILACSFNSGYWLLLLFITVPLSAGAISMLIEIVE